MRIVRSSNWPRRNRSLVQLLAAPKVALDFSKERTVTFLGLPNFVPLFCSGHVSVVRLPRRVDGALGAAARKVVVPLFLWTALDKVHLDLVRLGLTAGAERDTAPRCEESVLRLVTLFDLLLNLPDCPARASRCQLKPHGGVLAGTEDDLLFDFTLDFTGEQSCAGLNLSFKLLLSSCVFLGQRVRNVFEGKHRTAPSVLRRLHLQRHFETIILDILVQVADLNASAEAATIG